MVTNNREIGKKTGYWTGPEIEHTQFHGMQTLFISKWPCHGKALFMAMDDSAYPHVYFCMGSEGFWTGTQGGTLQSFYDFVSKLLAQYNKSVTLDVGGAAVEDLNSLWINHLRVIGRSRFCLLVTVRLPQPEIGSFAVKVSPPQTFTDRQFERCVMTVPCVEFLKRATHWSEYAVDVDGAE